MNNNGYYVNGLYKQNPTYVPEQGTNPNQNIGLPVYNQQTKQSHVEYADNIFYLNIGKEVSVYLSYPDSVEWRDKVFTGKIVDSGRDYLILKDANNQTILLWLIYINYAIFDGDIVYNYR